MYQFNSKYSFGKSNSFNNVGKIQNFHLGIVQAVGKVPLNRNDEQAFNRDSRFNADTHAIRCRILGSNNDNQILDSELPNCFPLLPKHLNFVPKIGEVVLLFTFSEDDKYSDRFYIGPIVSDVTKLKMDSINNTALSNFSFGLTRPNTEIDKIITADGIYDDPQNVIIDGRYNTDIIQRDNEVLIRAGKFKHNQPLVFNQTNPGYIQLKFNQTINENGTSKEVSVTNIVSNKINLLTYNGGSPQFNDLTSVNKQTKMSDYITTEQLNTILEEAHPLVFGDTLVEYLKLFRLALANHVHNGNGNKGTDRTDGNGLPLNDFLKNAERLEKEMLSKNIRIN